MVNVLTSNRKFQAAIKLQAPLDSEPVLTHSRVRRVASQEAGERPEALQISQMEADSKMSEVDKSSWDYEPEGGGGLFLKIEANSKVRVRIFTDPLFFPKTWQGETRDRWGVLVVAKVAVDGKKAHSVKAWEFGPMVKKQLAALFKNDDWGDVKDYDITIERKGSGMETSYAVVPAPKKDLDPADTALIEAFDKTPADIFLKNVGAANEDGCYDPFSDE